MEEVMSKAGQGAHAVYARCYAAEHNLAYAPVTHWLRSEPIRSGDRRASGIGPERTGSGRSGTAERSIRGFHLPSRWPKGGIGAASSRFWLGRYSIRLNRFSWSWTTCIGVIRRRSNGWSFWSTSTRRRSCWSWAPRELRRFGGKHALRPLLNRLIRDNFASEIVLSPLDREETAALARQVSRQKLDTPIPPLHLSRHGRKSPLRGRECTGRDYPASDPKENGSERRWHLLCTTRSLPPKVRAVLASRLAQLSSARP